MERLRKKSVFATVIAVILCIVAAVVCFGVLSAEKPARAEDTVVVISDVDDFAYSDAEKTQISGVYSYNRFDILGMSNAETIKVGGRNGEDAATYQDLPVGLSTTGREKLNAARANGSKVKLIIPEQVTSIGDGAFVRLFENNTEYFYWDFKGYENITEIEFAGNNCTSVGAIAFAGVGIVTPNVFPSSVTTFGAQIFMGCSFDTVTVTKDERYLLDGSSSFGEMGACALAGSIITNLIISNEGAEESENISQLRPLCLVNTQIENCFLPSTLSNMAGAVANMEALTGVNFGSVKNIYIDSFEHWLAIDQVSELSESFGLISSPLLTSKLYVGNATDGYNEVSVAPQLIVPATATKIGAGAFAEHTGIISVLFEDGDGGLEIGAKAFAGINMPMSIDEVVFSDRVVAIGEAAFENTDPAYIYAPTGFAATGFAEQFADKEIITTPYTGGNYVFKDGFTFTYDASNSAWNVIGMPAASDVTMPAAPFVDGNVTIDEYNIPANRFAGLNTVSNLVIPENSVGSIGDDAFSSSTSLKSVVIGAGVRYFGTGIFRNVQFLTSATIAWNGEIPDNTFNSCYNLSRVNMQGARVIGVSAFESCQALHDIILPDTVTEVKNKAFYWCEPTSLKLSANLRIIGESAFYIMSNVQSVTIPVTVESIGKNAFRACGEISFDTYEDGSSELKSIGDGAFDWQCKIITAIPTSVTSLGNKFCDTDNVILPAELTVAPEILTFQSCIVSEAYTADKAYYAERYGKIVMNNEDYKFEAGSGSGYDNYKLTMMPDYESYKVVYDYIKANYQTELAACKNSYGFSQLERLFYPQKVTYQVKRGEETVASQSRAVPGRIDIADETKTYIGVDIEYKVGIIAPYWEKIGNIREPFALPRKVGFITLADDVEWTAQQGGGIGDVVVDRPSSTDNGKKIGMYVTIPATDNETGAVLTATIASTGKIAVSLPFTQDTKVYDGQPWRLPTEYNDIFRVDRAPVNVNIINGNLTWHMVSVYIRDTSKYQWDTSNGSNYRTVNVTITPRESDLVWEYDGEPLNEGVIFEKDYDGVSIDSKLNVYMLAPNGETKVNVGSQYIRATRNGEYYDGAIVDAGNWTLSVDPLWDRNYNSGHLSHQFRINKANIELNSTENMRWGIVGENASLGNSLLYIYGQTPYLYEQPGLPGSPQIINAENSVIAYREQGGEPYVHTVQITDIAHDAQGARLYSASYINNSGNIVGMYTATAQLTAAANYKFTMSGLIVAERGVTVQIGDDGSTATVTKVWYIVANENRLVVSGGNDDWNIGSWNYGEDFDISAPALEHGNAVTFTLSGGSLAQPLTFGIAEFSNYINDSMPAGSYTLNADIADTVVDGAVYRGHSTSYAIEIAAADIEFELRSDDQTGFANYSWKLDNSDESGFFARFEELLAGEGVLGFTSKTPSGYWSDTGRSATSGYVVSYNLARMYNSEYLLASDGNLQRLIDGGVNGTYTVYFQITAPNHNPLTDMGEGRYAYFFTVTVYEEKAIPTVIDEGLVYTGSKVLPEIAENEWYEVVWTAADEYVDGGVHSVSFRLYDNVHYRWEGVEGDTATVEFRIAKADNAWTRIPNIIVWTYETFETDVNRILAVPRYLDDGKNVLFTITKADGTAIAGLTDFTVSDNGTIADNATLVATLNGLKAGAYKLTVKVEETDNYKLIQQSLDFNISKSMNSWSDGDDDLVLPSWIVGKYNEAENIIKVNAAHGQVNIVITDINGNEYYNSVTGVNKLNECEVGKYLLKAWVDETEDYAALAERTFTIEVLEKIGLPWWGTLLIVVGALAVAAAIIFILWKKGVFQILTGKIVLAIRTRANVDATIASVRAAKKMEEGRQSVAAAKRKEAAQARKEKLAAERALPAEERAATLEAKAQAEEKRIERIRARAEAMRARAERMREASAEEVAKDNDKAEAEAAATESKEPTTEE